MSREFLTLFREQNELIRDMESLKEGVEITVFKAEKAIASGLKREKEVKSDDTTRKEEVKRHRRHQAETKKQYVKNK